MKKILAVAVLLAAVAAGGCTSVGGWMKKGAEANDELINGSIYGLCNVYSVGSIKRKFDTEELRALYNRMCGTLSAKDNVL